MTTASMPTKQKFIKLSPDEADVMRDRLVYDGNNVRIGGPRLDRSHPADE